MCPLQDDGADHGKAWKKTTGQGAIIFIDVWKDKEPATRFGIRAIPTQMLLRQDGNEVYRHRGFMSEAAIVTVLRNGRELKPSDRELMIEVFFVTVNEWMAARHGHCRPGLFSLGHDQRAVQPLPPGLHSA